MRSGKSSVCSLTRIRRLISWSTATCRKQIQEFLLQHLRVRLVPQISRRLSTKLMRRSKKRLLGWARMGMVAMRLPDGTILMHARAPYDPVKAHQYYLRTRELKGRRKGRVQLPTDKSRPVVKPSLSKRAETFTVKLDGGKTAKLTSQQLTEQKVYAAKRVADIKSKLAELNGLLKQRMAEARQAEAKAKKGPTAADKAEAARESKKYREKHQQELSTKRKAATEKKPVPTKPTTDTVEGVKQVITEVQGRLKAAVERQRSLSSATKNG